jgi:hypothetical protein
MRANSCRSATYRIGRVVLIGTIWAGFASAMFPYCSPASSHCVLFRVRWCDDRPRTDRRIPGLGAGPSARRYNPPAVDPVRPLLPRFEPPPDDRKPI